MSINDTSLFFKWREISYTTDEFNGLNHVCICVPQYVKKRIEKVETTSIEKRYYSGTVQI